MRCRVCSAPSPSRCAVSRPTTPRTHQAADAPPQRQGGTGVSSAHRGRRGRRLQAYLEVYNRRRPHRSLDYETPWRYASKAPSRTGPRFSHHLKPYTSRPFRSDPSAWHTGTRSVGRGIVRIRRAEAEDRETVAALLTRFQALEEVPAIGSPGRKAVRSGTQRPRRSICCSPVPSTASSRSRRMTTARRRVC
jgi:hypothetical protein